MDFIERKFLILNAFMETTRTQYPLEDLDLCLLKNIVGIKYIVFPLVLISLIKYM